MDKMHLVYEGHFAKSNTDAPRPNLLRLMVDYEDGAVFLVRSESRYPEPAQTEVCRFHEPDDEDWRAGHGLAFDEACQHLLEVIQDLNASGYDELKTSPGWIAPPPAVFQNYLMAERSRHPLPLMH